MFLGKGSRYSPNLCGTCPCSNSASGCLRYTCSSVAPGSGKTFSIIEPFIRQHSAKGFAMVVYDYKFPTLAQKLYYHYKINQKAGKVPQGCKFKIIDFV